MQHGSRARANLPGRRSYPASFGARHPIRWDGPVRFFFSDVDRALADIIPEQEIVDQKGKAHYPSQFRIYDDPAKLGMTVLERGVSAEHSRRHHLEWTANDVGRIVGRITDQLGVLGLPEYPVEVTLTNTVRVGSIDKRTGTGRKLAVIVDQETDAAEFLVREHEIIMAGLGTGLRKFKYPYDEFVPKMTIGYIHREVEHEKLNQCVAAVNQLLPLVVQLEPVQFYSQQQV